MDDELSFSNWIVYYLRNDAQLFLKFASEILRLNISEDAQILREYKNIDIFIKDQNHAIVIENKIKSGINGIRHDLQAMLCALS
ncbi:PD-(D/E)XK nuclease family protein [uncultured Campylobacter sp.]|uniref:PD-(D/E)XK nuclease family protein n=1 Tax=uncultured Campylobacter sp. TaxID=218934 RepID=UPI0026145390|nr:PD-(D/E)XK nuclease family protein [uncultured Campylobacter sp.]